jgi:hypothetical protein
MRWLRWITFVLFLAALAGYQYYAVFLEEPDPSQHVPAAKDVHLSREVYGDCQLMQTFVIHTGGFSAIEIFPRKSAHPPEGLMGVRISDGRTATYRSLTATIFDSASLDLNSSLRIPIPRVDDSAGGLFMIEIWMTQAGRGHGLRFEQGGPTYPDGILWTGCAPDWGDLKFRTEVQRTTIFSNIQHLRRSLPAPLRSDAALLAMLLAGNWALATVVYALAFAPERGPSREREPAANQSPNGSAGTTAVQPRV